MTEILTQQNNSAKELMENTNKALGEIQGKEEDITFLKSGEQIPINKSDILNRYNSLEEKIKKMESWDRQTSFIRLLVIIQSAIDNEDLSQADDWLTRLEQVIDNNTIANNDIIANNETKEKPNNIVKNIENSNNSNEEGLRELISDDAWVEKHQWTHNIQLK